MAPSFVNSEVGGANATSMTDLLWPSGIAAGDFAFIGWVASSGVTMTDVPTFTAISNQVGDSGTMQARTYGRILTGSEVVGAALQLDCSAINRHCACLWVGRGLHASTPADAWSVPWADESASVSTHASPSATPNFNEDVILTFACERATTGSTSLTGPGGAYTKRADTTTLATGSGGTICALADDLATGKTSGTPYTPGNWASGSGFSTANFMIFTLALRTPVVATASSIPSTRQIRKTLAAMKMR